MIIAIIVAVAKDNIIGAGNTIPWYCPEDLKYFKRTTLGYPVLMGRKTYDSLKIKPLPGRKNIIITRDHSLTIKGCDVVTSIEQGIALSESTHAEKLFVIGGADIYRQCIPFAQQLYITEVDVQVKGDCHFPEVDESIWSLYKQDTYLADDKNPHNMIFKMFVRTN